MSKPSPTELVICIAEDRKSHECALKLLLASLARHNAKMATVLFYPASDEAFIDWLQALNAENISIRTTPIADASSWNVKPHALLHLLAEGFREIIWIDSDILITKNFLSAFDELDDAVLAVCEEGLLGQDEENRAMAWGFAVERKFPFPLNTGVMRVTQRHVPVLARWKELLDSGIYRDAQSQPMTSRPRHMFSDQDVLTALLSSDEFSDVPVKILRRGRDVIQYYEYLGFTLAERVTCMLQGMPAFIHQQGWKPWISGTEKELPGVRGKIIAAYQDQSPYTVTAIATALTETPRWMLPRSKFSSFVRTIGFGYPPLTGLPLAIVFDLERLANLPVKITKDFFKTCFPTAFAALHSWRSDRDARS